MLGEALCRALRERADGVVEWRSDKKRRLFFFEGGELVLAQSNIKGESLERIGEQTPGLDEGALRWRVLTARVANALGEAEGEVAFHAGVTAPRRDPADLVALLWAAAEQLPAVADTGWPRAVPGQAGVLERLPIAPEVVGYLQGLDGARDVEDVLSFGPADPDVLRWGLAVGAAIGAIEVEQAEVVVRVVANAARGASSDIGDLIRDELGGAPPADDPVAKRFGPLLARIRGARDHFATLGGAPTDPPDMLRKKYFGLARELHPDGFATESPEVRAAAAELFDRVREAWEVVGDDAAREAYVARVIRGEKTEDEKAMEKVQAILEAEGLFRRGKAEFNAGRIPVAHELFTKAAAAVPEEAEFSAYAGFTTFRINQGRDELAAEDGVRRLKAALDANEKLDGAWVLMGMVQRLRGNDAAARQAFVAALKLNPSNPDAMREMRRNERERKDTAPPGEEKPVAGFFARLFGKK